MSDEDYHGEQASTRTPRLWWPGMHQNGKRATQVETLVELIDVALNVEVRFLAYPDVLAGLREIFKLHSPAPHGWALFCPSCGSESGGPDLLPCETLIALGKILGVEYVRRS